MDLLPVIKFDTERQPAGVMETLEPNNLWYPFTGQCSRAVVLEGFGESNASSIKHTHFKGTFFFLLVGGMCWSEQEYLYIFNLDSFNAFHMFASISPL